MKQDYSVDEEQTVNLMAADVLEMCKVRGWSLHWAERGAYLHLESSELIEAVRGKRGSVKEEAGDVLLVLMSITEYAGIPFSEVVSQTKAKLDGLFTKPHYAGEEWSETTNLTDSPNPDRGPRGQASNLDSDLEHL